MSLIVTILIVYFIFTVLVQGKKQTHINTQKINTQNKTKACDLF